MGDYTCLAENAVGVYNHTTTLNVYGSVQKHTSQTRQQYSFKMSGKMLGIIIAIKGSHLLWIYIQIKVTDFLLMIWKPSHTYFKHVPPTFKHRCAYYLLLKHHTMLIKHFLHCTGKGMLCGLHVNKTIFPRNDERDKSILLPFLTAPRKCLQKAHEDPPTGLSMRMH